jgi:hypothetical protein
MRDHPVGGQVDFVPLPVRSMRDHPVGGQADFVSSTCEEYAGLFIGHPVFGRVNFVVPVWSLLYCA